MKIIGIVGEYNPFHNGHIHLINSASRIVSPDYIFSVMSGNFLQRGNIAIQDKWVRSRHVIRQGVDLVFELPFVYACNSANYFAKGSVELLSKLGATHIAFGSEIGDVDILTNIAKAIVSEDDKFKKMLKEGLSLGKSFYDARCYALNSIFDIGLLESNDILAIEYISEIIKNDINIEPVVIKRKGSDYNSSIESDKILSATGIRKRILDQSDYSSYLPKEVKEDIVEYIDNSKLDPLLMSRIMLEDKSFWGNIFGAREGIENIILSNKRKIDGFYSASNFLLSKRYARSSINRFLIHAILNLRKNDFEDILNYGNIYGRVLSFNEKGRRLLNYLKNKVDIPIISKIDRYTGNNYGVNMILKYDILASDLYNNVTGHDVYSLSDYKKHCFYDKF